MMLNTNCAINSVDPFTPTNDKPWNARRVAHLYRRLGFGASLAQIQDGLNMSPSALVDQLIDEASGLPLPIPPYWANYLLSDYDGQDDLIDEHRKELVIRWLREMHEEGIRSRMAFFWHNHFVTELREYECNSSMWSYYRLLHQYAFGNFRVFVEEIGRNSAMLIYLNGNENVAAQPNENYARELLELYTLGESNGYTQTDVVELSRALTGWVLDEDTCGAASFDPALFDNGQKTIFGQTGNWDYIGVHTLIFTERIDLVAEFICQKLYQYFVYDEPNPDVIGVLAATFKANNFAIKPVLKQLFKSEHFFEDAVMDARIKDPVDCFIPVLRSLGLSYPEDFTEDTLNFIANAMRAMGQELFNPVDVAGWPGYRSWINENTLAFRWGYVSQLLHGGLTDDGKAKLVALAIELTNDSNDPTVITNAIAQHYVGRPLEPEHLEVAEQYFKGDIPENYYDDGSWNLYWNEAPYQIINLLDYLSRLPEFQLT